MAQHGFVKALSARTTSIRTTTIVGVCGIVLGIAMGTQSASPDTTESPSYLSLQGDFESVTDDRAELQAQTRELVSDNEKLSALNAALSAENDEMAVARSDVEQDRQKLAVSLERLTERIAEVEEREQAVEAAAGVVTVAPPLAAAPEPDPAADAPLSAYYDNCTGARTAGAAPVRVGDPGYGRHLDRDGDGVGCE